MFHFGKHNSFAAVRARAVVKKIGPNLPCIVQLSLESGGLCGKATSEAVGLVPPTSSGYGLYRHVGHSQSGYSLPGDVAARVKRLNEAGEPGGAILSCGQALMTR